MIFLRWLRFSSSKRMINDFSYCSFKRVPYYFSSSSSKAYFYAIDSFKALSFVFLLFSYLMTEMLSISLFLVIFSIFSKIFRLLIFRHFVSSSSFSIVCLRLASFPTKLNHYSSFFLLAERLDFSFSLSSTNILSILWVNPSIRVILSCFSVESSLIFF